MNWRKNTIGHRGQAYVIRPVVPSSSVPTKAASSVGVKLLIIAGVCSAGLHGALAFGMLGVSSKIRKKRSYQVRVIGKPKPKPPAPLPEAEPPAEPAPEKVAEAPRQPVATRRPQVQTHKAARPPAPRASESKPVKKEVFGLSSKSLAMGGGSGGAAGGTSFAVPVGDTLQKEPDKTPLLSSAKIEEKALPQPRPEPQPKKRKPSAPKTYTLSQVTVRPKVVRRASPSYTSEALDAEVEGVVKVEVVLDKCGCCRSVKVVKGLGYGLDQSAENAVRHSQFTPCMIGSRPVSCRLRIPYRFRLQ